VSLFGKAYHYGEDFRMCANVDSDLAACAKAAMDLVEHAKQMGATALEWPVHEESGDWVVIVKRAGPKPDSRVN
jgi:hypothetical protein